MADQSVIHMSVTNPRSILIATATLSGLWLTGCASNAHSQQKGGGQAPPPLVAEFVTATPQDTPIFSEYPGQTYARNLVEVRGRVTGYVEKWMFRPGQRVSAGQPLYTLDIRPFRAQVQQAQGTVRQAEADVVYAKNQVSLLQAEAALAAAQANLVKAEQDFNRLKPLVEQDAAARQDLDAATAALTAARADVRANDASVKQARLNTDTQIQSAEGRLQTQRGNLSSANLNVEYGTIRAPITGMVGDTQVPVGGLVNPNAENPLTTIVPLDPIWVRFKLSESQFLEYQQMRGKPGQGPTLELFLADGTKFPQPGRIDNALNQVDPRTGTLEVQARFPNPQGALLPGQFARVRFQSRTREDAIAVPQRAVQQNQSLQSVFVIGSGNKLEVRPVKTGERVGDDWIIEGGLRAGDRVVVEGLMLARPGMPVTPKPYTAKAGTNAPAADGPKGPQAGGGAD